jgi:NAD(P)H-hydrate epimerase
MRREEGLVYVTAEEMAAIDRAAIDDFKIDVLSLMENAGLATAGLARRRLGGKVASSRIACLVGKGNNGGDGLVSSRHLNNWGADVVVVLSTPREQLGETTARQLFSVEAMGAKVLGPAAELKEYDLLIDGLLGYGSKGAPREPMAALIRRANDSGVPILAIDIPSGLDTTTGAPNEPCIEATATLTLGLPKTGFLNPQSKRFVGELYLGDVSLPFRAYTDLGLTKPLFGGEQFIRIG